MTIKKTQSRGSSEKSENNIEHQASLRSLQARHSCLSRLDALLLPHQAHAFARINPGPALLRGGTRRPLAFIRLRFASARTRSEYNLLTTRVTNLQDTDDLPPSQTQRIPPGLRPHQQVLSSPRQQVHSAAPLSSFPP